MASSAKSATAAAQGRASIAHYPMKKPLRGQPQAAEAEVHTCASKSPDEGISLDTDRALRAVEASLAGREHAPNGRDQTLEFDRFGIELVAPCDDGLLALAL